MPDLVEERSAANPFDLRGRVAIVTGASSGLGARFAKVIAAAGATVVLAGRRRQLLEGLASTLGLDPRSVVPTDVTDPHAVRALVDTTTATFGRLDVMINNAGMTKVVPAEDEAPESFAQVLDVNLVGVFNGCREAARVMLQQGSGSIVNVASALAFVSSPSIPQAAYCASKGAIVSLTRELAVQWVRRGVRVNAIAPGWFPSEMSRAMFDATGLRYIDRTVPAGRPGREHELDGILLFLASDASSYVVGQTISVDGGWTAI
ncbi:SDR family oxidoreductase [bacterium]|nr:MAG: SDR family oxidoreductase [bacterium]